MQRLVGLLALTSTTLAFSLKDTLSQFYENRNGKKCDGCKGHSVRFDQYDFKAEIHADLVPYKEGSWLSTSAGINVTLTADISIPLQILGIDETLNIRLKEFGQAGTKGTNPSAWYISENHVFGYDFNHALKLEPLSYSTKNLFTTDLRIVSNYTDDGLITWIFNTATGSRIPTKRDVVLDILMDTRKGCTKTAHIFEDDKIGLSTFKPKEKCIMQMDFVVDHETELQSQLIFYKQFTQLKTINKGEAEDGSDDLVRTLRIAHNEKDRGYDYYYRHHDRAFEIVMTHPNMQRLEDASKIFHDTFAWVDTLSWSSLLHLKTYNELLDVKNFDLTPTLRELHFTIYEPFRANMLKYLFGSMYNELKEILSSEYIVNYIARLAKNLLKQLDEPSEDLHEYISFVTDNSQEIENLIDSIFAEV